MKKFLLVISLIATAAFAAASLDAKPVIVEGKVFLDADGDGTADRGEKGIPSVIVSDGFSVVRTDNAGRFSMELGARSRFVTVYTPSGYRHTNRFFTDVRSLVSGQEPDGKSIHRGNDGFDFGLEKAPVAGSFAHMSDIEERNYETWIDRLRDYCSVNDHDFIAITGDICYAPGLVNMSRHINDDTMGKRIVFTLGNHDLIKGNTDYLGNPYGEKNFEDAMGPSWYAFFCDGVTFVVTPMMQGDAKPSYTLDDIRNWYKAFLSFLPEDAPLVIFNHDANTSLIPEGANTKAFVYGHRHTQYRTITDQGVPFFCTMAYGKGSNDHAPSALRRMQYNTGGIYSTSLRYSPLSNYIVSHVAPVEGGAVLRAVVYDAAADVSSVTALFPDGKSYSLKRDGDMMWQIAVPSVPEGFYSVTADFADGERAVCRTMAESALKWMGTVGSKPFFCTSVVSEGRIYVATIDNEMCGSCGIYALSAADGSGEWFFHTENSVHGDIALSDGVIYACDTDYNVYAVNAADGSLKWKRRIAVTFYPSLTEGVLVEDGKVYAGTAGNLCALDARDGSLVWKNTHKHGSITNVGTLRTAAGALLANGYWVGRFCYDKATGDFLWENREYQSRYSSCTPLVVDTTFVYAGYNSLMQVGARSGKVLKYNEFPTIFNVKSEPVSADGRIFIGSSHSGVWAINMEDFSKAWNFECGIPLIYTSPYTKNAEKTVECSPALWRDNIIVGANDGYVYCLSQDGGKQIWRINVGLPVLGKPIVEGDSLIIIDFAGNIYCYSLGEII